LLFSQRFFTRVEFRFPLSKLLVALSLSFSSQAFLHLSLDFSLPFFLGLLLLAGAKYRQRNNYRQGEKVLHVRIRPPSIFRYSNKGNKTSAGRSRIKAAASKAKLPASR